MPTALLPIVLLFLISDPIQEAPCATPEHRQLDFWVGEWEVTDPGGRPQGRSRVTRILDGCVIQEEWDAGAVQGKSLSAWDARSGVWRQTYMDGGGGVLLLEGSLRNGAMVLEGERPGPDGAPRLHRIIWEPRDDGSVRQLYEASADGGAVWEEVFDGRYRPAAAPVGGEGARKLSRVRLSYPTYATSETVLFESAAAGEWDIYRMPAGGMADAAVGLERLTDAPGLDRMPSMSPDGRYIAFISDRGGSYDVWRMDADGAHPVRLTTSDVHEIHPYWTPDSRRIVFNRQVAGERLYAIWSIDADGGDEREVLRDDELNSYAQVSPDGRLLVFDKWWGNQESNGEIMVMDLASGRLTRMTDNSVYDGYPTWFPDSRHVLFSSEVDGVFKLFRLDVRTGRTEQLTFGPGHDARADVSDDGRRVVFNRELDGSIEIYELVLEEEAAPFR